MKTFFFIMLITLASFSLFAQTVEIKTQNDIDSFNYETVENLYIKNAFELSSLAGFASLKNITNDLIISENGNLQSLSGFENLESIGAYLKIENNKKLSSINAFPKLKNIDQQFEITRNAVEVISGFSKLNKVGNIYIRKTTLKNVDFLSSADIYGFIVMEENNNLLNIDGLLNVKSARFIDIRNNESLTSIEGFANCNKFHFLQITNNDALTNLSGLEALDTLESFIVINENSSLTSISAITNLSYIGLDFIIVENENLTDCDAIEQIINTATIMRDTVVHSNNCGFVYIEKSTTGFDSYEEQNIAVYPNPTNSHTTIDIGDNSDYTIKIYSQSGQLIHNYKNINSSISINWNENQKGLYLYQVSSKNKTIQSGKIIVE